MAEIMRYQQFYGVYEDWFGSGDEIGKLADGWLGRPLYLNHHPQFGVWAVGEDLNFLTPIKRVFLQSSPPAQFQ